MKIRIKNQNNKIFEATPSGMPSSASSTVSGGGSSSGSATPTAYNALVGTIQNQYIQKQRKDATVINFAIPKIFSEPFSFGGAPQDIINLMQAFQQNKARKTKNIGDMSEDPIQTFEHAHDYCKDIFGKYSTIEFDTDPTTVGYNKAKVISDNFQYNYDFPTLNESPITTAAAAGVAVGNTVGTLGAAGITFLNTAGATFLANIIPAVLPVVVTGELIGKGLAAVGSVRPGDISNDIALKGKKMIPAHLQKDGMLGKPVPTALDKSKKDSKSFNVIEHIDQYIENILNSINNMVNVISPTTADKIGDLESYVRDMMETETSNVKAYIAANSERAKKIQIERENRKREKTQNELNNYQDKDKFAKKLYNLKINNTKEYTFIARVINWYGENLNKSNEQTQNIIQKLEDTDIKSISELNEIIGKIIKLDESDNSTESTNYLNEAGEITDNSGELTRNVSKIYKQLHNKFLKICGDAFAATGKDLYGIADCKEEMQGMIKKADETINSRIDIITKYSQGNGGDGKGLSQQAKEFLLGHPLESNNLKEVWSRHLADLNGRMNKRLRQMQDAQNEERTLGWTKRFCKIVVPDLLARLLCYRYMYGILLNEGFYSYNTEKMQEDIKTFDKVKDSYISDFKEKILWLLYHYSAKYTSTGNPIVDPATDGGYAVSENTLSYGIFLLHNLNSLINGKSGCIYALGLANLQKINSPSEKLDALINNIFNLSRANIQNLMQLSASDPDFENKFNNLAGVFENCEILDKTKDYIRNTYNNINNLQSEIKDNNKESIYYSFEIFNQIKSTGRLIEVFGKNDNGKINVLITQYKNLQNTGNNETDIKNSEEYKKIKAELISYLSSLGISKNEFTVSKFNNVDLNAPFKLSEYNVDYYAYILQCWYEPMFGTIPSNIFEENTIKTICNTVYNSLNFIMSGILSMLVKNVEAKVNNIDNNLPKVKETLVKLANGVNFLNKLPGTFFGNTSSGVSNSGQPFSELKVLQSNVFGQLNNSYVTISNDSSILIPDLFNLTKSKSKKEELNVYLNGAVAQLKTNTDTPDNIKKSFNDAKISSHGTISSSTFEHISEDEKNTILNNIYNAIDEVENKGQLKKYISIIDGIIHYCDEKAASNLSKNSSTK